jgi:hypothetical protein
MPFASSLAAAIKPFLTFFPLGENCEGFTRKHILTIKSAQGKRYKLVPKDSVEK